MSLEQMNSKLKIESIGNLGHLAFMHTNTIRNLDVDRKGEAQMVISKARLLASSEFLNSISGMLRIPLYSQQIIFTAANITLQKKKNPRYFSFPLNTYRITFKRGSYCRIKSDFEQRRPNLAGRVLDLPIFVFWIAGTIHFWDFYILCHLTLQNRLCFFVRITISYFYLLLMHLANPLSYLLQGHPPTPGFSAQIQAVCRLSAYSHMGGTAVC